MPLHVIALIGLLSTAQLVASTPTDDGRLHAPGHWVRTLSAGQYHGLDEDDALDAYELRSALAYYMRRYVAGVGELHATRFDGENEGVDVDSWTFGGNLLLRWHPIQVRRFSVYVDYGVGINVSTKDFPPNGTRFNFSRQYGIGATALITRGIHFVVGVRELHVSNGKGLVDENPSFDGVGGVVGVSFRYRGL